jgi:hypothetical protein
MADPISIAVITGLVALMTGYMKYRADMKQAEQKGAAAPAKTEEVTKGETALAQVKQGVAQHGDEKDQNALAQFETDPDDYRDVFEKKLARLAERSPAFAQQLQTVAQQANIQTGGVQGSVNVSGEGKVYGPVVGANTGTISGTYTLGKKDDKGDQK